MRLAGRRREYRRLRREPAVPTVLNQSRCASNGCPGQEATQEVLVFTRLLIVSFTGLGLVACMEKTLAPDVAAFRQLDERLVTAVDTHCVNTAAMADMGACTAERDRYDAEARPIVDQMTTMSTSMDDCMMAMGRDNLADMQTTCRGMGDELTSHLGAACASADMAQNAAEADRHCGAMRAMAQLEMDRVDNMSQDGSMMSNKMPGKMSGGSCHQ